jgi:hypothetical protein
MISKSFVNAIVAETKFQEVQHVWTIISASKQHV